MPLAIRIVHLADDADEESASQNKEEDEQSTFWLPQYTSAQLREKQEEYPDLGKLITWLENDVTPTTQEPHLSSPAVKRFWLNKNLLTIKNKVLYYTWEDYPFSRMLLMVPQTLQEEVLHEYPY